MKMTRREMMQGTLAAMPAMGMMTSGLSLDSNAEAAADGGTVLLRDDFSKLPAGWLTYPVGVQNTAIQENQWIDARAHKFGAWSNAVADQDAWLVSSGSGDRQAIHDAALVASAAVSAVLIAGEDEWADYTYQALVRPLAFDGIAGIAFRYQNNLQFYVLGLTGGNTVQINVQHLISAEVPSAELGDGGDSALPLQHAGVLPVEGGEPGHRISGHISTETRFWRCRTRSIRRARSA